jgi:uncharacterized membrane protein YdjX (TVP38/TMEM64 family)
MNLRLTRPRAALLFLLIFGLALALYLSPDNLLSRTLVHLKSFQAESAVLRSRFLTYGPLAPLLFILLQVVQVVVAPIPGEASGFLGGYIFGALPGFLYSSVGLTLGSWVAFGGGRLLSAFFTGHFLHTRVYQRFNHLVSRGDFLIPFVLFLLPGFPKDSLSYLLGLSTMPWPVFLFIAAVGRMPGTLLLSLQGAETFDGNYLRLVLLTIFSALVIVPCLLGRHRILTRLNRWRRERAVRKQDKRHD